MIQTKNSSIADIPEECHDCAYPEKLAAGM